MYNFVCRVVYGNSNILKRLAFVDIKQFSELIKIVLVSSLLDNLQGKKERTKVK